MVHLITDNIDIWISAQTQKSSGAGRGNGSANHNLYGIKKLRELILELAVRGKLVPQDPSDEPASVLLGKIAAERARLIKEGKIKKENPLPEITDDEKLFELPVGWMWTNLGNVQIFTNGYAFKSEDYQPSGVGIIRMSELGVDGEIDETNMKYVSQEIADSLPSFFQVNPGDLLMGMSGSIGKLAVNNSPKVYLLNQRVGRLAPILIEKSYLKIVLKTLEQYYLHISFGMAIKNLSTKQINATPITLPPQAEQKRIVAKVDELMAICDQLEQQQTNSNAAQQALVEALLAALTSAADQKEFVEGWQRISNHFDILFTTEKSIDQLKQTILQLAVMGKLVPQDPNDEPANLLLKKIATEKERLIKEGKIRKQEPLPEIREEEEPFKLPEGWEFERFGNVTLNRDAERVPLSVDERRGRQGDYDYYGASGVIDSIDGYLFDKPLLLIGEDGANLLYRSTPIAFIAKDKYWVNNHAHVIDGLSEELLHYVCLHINAISLVPYVTGTAQPKMNQAKMNSIILALPPQAEQKRIVAKVDELMAICDSLKERINDAQTIQIQLADAIVKQAVI